MENDGRARARPETGPYPIREYGLQDPVTDEGNKKMLGSLAKGIGLGMLLTSRPVRYLAIAGAAIFGYSYYDGPATQTAAQAPQAPQSQQRQAPPPAAGACALQMDVAGPALPARFKERTTMVCATGFAVLHSALTKGPLWASERLTADRVRDSREMIRESEFFAEPSLPPRERSENADYARSGYDRGHLAPSGDMPDPDQQQESFTLANVVPQHAESNRKLWRDIESAVRKEAVRRGEVVVVTGVLFQGERLQSIGRNVLVPTSLFKAVLDPRTNEAAAYLAPNAPGYDYQVVSIAQLRDMTGIDVFPARANLKTMRPMAPAPYRKRN